MNPYSSYQRNQILEASQEDILLQLVQGALIRAKQAYDLWGQDQAARARGKSLRCLDIISYLGETLDRENGGEQTINQLDALYAYLQREISESIRTADASHLEPVIEVLEVIYDGWKDAVGSYKQEQTSQGPSTEYGQASSFAG
jgi:flagellar protein FliS